ncbi:MAG: hypothetical protein LBH11_02870 [Propionibacteriaceae bacterium]|nr:hypothetical protein [Propionibacteriaceae bacterium]
MATRRAQERFASQVGSGCAVMLLLPLGLLCVWAALQLPFEFHADETGRNPLFPLFLGALGVSMVIGGLSVLKGILRNPAANFPTLAIPTVALVLIAAIVVANIIGFTVGGRAPHAPVSYPPWVQARYPVKGCGDSPALHQEDGLTIRYQRLDVRYFGVGTLFGRMRNQYQALITIVLCVDNSSSTPVELHVDNVTAPFIASGTVFEAHSFPAMSRGLAAYGWRFSGPPAEPLSLDWLSLTLSLTDETLKTTRTLGTFDVTLPDPLLLSPPHYNPPSITPQVILDTPALTLTATGLTLQDDSVDLNVQVENRTGRTCTISSAYLHEASISGLNAELQDAQITAAPESQITLSVTPSSLWNLYSPALEHITDIAFTFHVMDASGTLESVPEYNRAHVQTSHFGQVETSYTVPGDELFANESLTVFSAGADIGVGVLDVYLVLENHSDYTLEFTPCAWNGIKCMPPTRYPNYDPGIVMLDGCVIEMDTFHSASRLYLNSVGLITLHLNREALSSCGASHYTKIDFALRATDTFSGATIAETPLLSYDIA